MNPSNSNKKLLDDQNKYNFDLNPHQINVSQINDNFVQKSLSKTKLRCTFKSNSNSKSTF